jgi:hypothetical protein
MQYNVFRGEYPFNDRIGVVEAPDDQPELALQRAKEKYKQVDHNPVVEPQEVSKREEQQILNALH